MLGKIMCFFGMHGNNKQRYWLTYGNIYDKSKPLDGQYLACNRCWRFLKKIKYE